MKFYEYSLKVPKNAIDINSHVNNVVYVQWMQDVATAHSKAVGDTLKYQKETNSMWVAKNHNIDYKQQAYENDEIKIKTWADKFKKASCVRKYEFTRNEELIATAESTYVFLDSKTKKPKKLTDEILKMYSD